MQVGCQFGEEALKSMTPQLLPLYIILSTEMRFWFCSFYFDILVIAIYQT